MQELQQYFEIRPSIFSWLARTCKACREAAEKSLADIGREINKDPSTVYRFEEQFSFPRDIEGMVAAYAEVAEVPAPLLWADALYHWARSQNLDGYSDLRERALGTADVGDELQRLESMITQRTARFDNIDHRIDSIEEAVKTLLAQNQLLARHLGIRE